MRALLTFLVVGLVACDRSIDEIEQQRGLWLASSPQNYSYTIQVSGWRTPRELLHPKRVTVRDSEVFAEYVWDEAGHYAGEPATADSYWSIAATFDELIEAKRRDAQVRARFDERFGFVERAFVDYGTELSGWNVEIREFEEFPSTR